MIFLLRSSILLLVVGMVTLVAAACSAGTTATSLTAESQVRKVSVEGAGSYTDVGAAGLAAMLKTKDFPLVNVHIPYEGEIEGTDLFIPYNELGANLGKLPSDRGAKVVLYCRSGSMSATAARTLVKLGYTNVWNLDGGMAGWRQEGYSLQDKGRR